ncbi:MAG: hypothetical protein IKU43_09795 [Clostridia bacterium]|nr:hypothetical protein [Clostridia bacterium]
MLKDTRFRFLEDMGFDADDINYQFELWAESVIDYAADEYNMDEYIENISILLKKCDNHRFILYMFFIYSDSFVVSSNLFAKRLDIIEGLLGADYFTKMAEDFFETGESRIFSKIGVLTDDDEWAKSVEESAKQILSRQFS